MSKRMYVYSVMIDNYYEEEETFDDPIHAIELAMQGQTIAILDALSLEYLGYIE